MVGNTMEESLQPATFQPTLPRLLSLDKDYPDLKERITQAARIVDLETLFNTPWPQFTKHPSPIYEDVQQFENPRREWVFKWLLDKLKTAPKKNDREHVAYTQSQEVWRLLRLLLPTIPGTVAARHLSTYGFVTLLENALLNIYLRRPAARRANENGTETGSRKRKRPGSPESKSDLPKEGTTDPTCFPSREVISSSEGRRIWKEAGYDGEGLDAPELLAVSYEILALLQDLHCYLRGPNEIQDLVAREQIRSVLRTSTAQSANITRLLFNLAATRAKLDSIHFARNLPPLLLIWETRQLEANEGIDPSLKAFCDQLLLPMLALTSSVRNKKTSIFEDVTASIHIDRADHETFFDRIKDLAKRNFALPARKAFKDAQASKAPQKFDYAVLQSLLKPVRDALDINPATLANGDGEGLPVDADESEISRIRGSIPSLLHDIIMPARSPATSDDIDIPWGENLVAVFAECIGYPLVGKPTKTGINDEIFQDLIDVSVTHEEDDNIARSLIGTEMMEEVVHRYSGLSKATKAIKSDKILWRVIEIALRFHGDIFLPRRHNAGTTDRKSRAMLLTTLTGLTVIDESSIIVAMQLMNQHIRARDLKGFVTAWNQGLKENLLNSKTADVDSRLWPQSKLRALFVQDMEKSLIPTQVIQLVTDFIGPIGQYRTELTSKSGDDNKVTTEPDARAAAYLLAAIFDGIKNEETVRQLQSALLAIEQALKGILLSGLLNGPSASWFWKLLIKVYEFMSIETDPTVMDARRAGLFESGLITRAQAQYLQERADKRMEITEAINITRGPSAGADIEMEEGDDDQDEAEDEDDDYEPRPPRELPLPDSSAAYQFVMAICAACLEAGENEDEAQNAMVTINEHIFISTAKWGWKSLPENSEHEARSPELRLCALVLLRYPHLMLAMKKEQTIDLFTAFMIAAAVEQRQQSLKGTELPWSRHSQALVSAILELGAHSLKDAMMQAIVTACAALGNLEQMPLGFFNICLKLIEMFRPTTMSRKDREAILDLILSPWAVRNALAVRTLGLAAQILTAPALTSRICADPECLSTLAQMLDRQMCSLYGHILPAFTAVFDAAFRQIFADPQQDRRQAFIYGFNRIIAKFLTALIDGDKHLDEPEIIVALALSWFEHLDTAGADARMSESLVSKLSECWYLYLNAQTRIAHISELQERVSNSARLVKIAKRYREEELPRIFKICDEEFGNASDSEATRNNKYWNLLTQGLRPAGCDQPADNADDDKTNKDRMFDLAAVDFTKAGQWMTMEESFELNESLQGLISDKSNLERVQLLLDWVARGGVGARGTHLDLMILTALQAPQSDQERKIVPDLQHYVVSLLETTGTTASHNVFMRNMRSIKLILKEKPWMITQHAIDTLISTMTKIISPSTALRSHDGFFYEIHDNLCQGLRLVLSLHRRRLNGRLHLVIPLLQALMTSLFTPHNTTDTSRTGPNWIDARLQPDSDYRPSIKSYTRCLTTLCSPTVSSVSAQHKNRNRLDLVDQTKKARDHIGLYTPSLITHFCASQLAGSLHPSLRDQLLPGLWACIDVVSEEGLGVMNDAMGRDVRALWHSLYAEYKRTRDRGD